MNHIELFTEELEEIGDLPSITEDDNETLKLSEEAANYLLSHKWCDEIEKGWLAVSWGYILGVFLFKIDSSVPEVDDYVWMVVGDLPPAYIDIESAVNPNEAIESYIEIMNDWVECVENGNSLDQCYPVEAPGTLENAKMLKTRLRIITDQLNQDL